MWRTVILYAIAIAAAATLLQWLEYKYVTRFFSTELYIVILTIAFTALGIWVGSRLTRRIERAPFEKNTAALQSLGVTDREYEVLELLAGGCSNKEIARRLEVSPNTVKTHVARLYEKLAVTKRIEAVQKAKDLALIR
jgi:DNA-binding NarL/FixJ family response regulator